MLTDHFDDLIEIAPAEALRFAANAVVLGKTIVMNSGCPQLVAELQTRGYEVHVTPLDEFLKAGGSAKCLTMHLNRWG